MNKYEIIPADEAHVTELAANMRKADVDEVWASTHRSPLEGLRVSFLASRDTRVGLANGKVVCMFAVASPSPFSTRAYPWMLGSEDLPKYAHRFLRESRKAVEEMRAKYPVLQNYVDQRNTLSIRWLGWLGFTLHEPIPFGPDQLPFHPFDMRQA